MKYPFSPVFALKTTLSYNMKVGALRSTDAFTLEFPKQSANSVIAKEELIYDNTKSLGMNLFDGTRFKIFW
ncbi:MAG: hypothetical protein R2759_03570 [Bacteroidales bacterium]